MEKIEGVVVDGKVYSLVPKPLAHSCKDCDLFWQCRQGFADRLGPICGWCADSYFRENKEMTRIIKTNPTCHE